MFIAPNLAKDIYATTGNKENEKLKLQIQHKQLNEMNQKLTLKTRIIFTGVVTILIWAHLAWDYFHDGVPTHRILQSEDLPGISNWWGGIVLPLFTWLLLYLIQKRMNINNNSNINSNSIHFTYRFLGGLLFGILLSFFFSIGSEIPGYMMIGIIPLSFFIPLYRPEYILGFVLGMTYTFGAILPIVVGIILTILFIISYKLIRSGILYIVSKIK